MAFDNGYYSQDAEMEFFGFEEAPMSAGSYADYDGMTGGVSLKGQSTQSADRSTISDTRKIIRTVDLTLETKTFDQAVSDISSGVEKLGGYIENSYVSGRSLNSADSARYASFTVRIPAASLDEYVGYIEGSYHVTSHNTNAQDITDSYYDTEARLQSLLTQEERLLAMLEDANELQYMLQLEDKLADVRYQIESYHSTLQRYDKQVAMSTVSIQLNEVMEFKPVTTLPKSFGERMSQAISNSWDNFVDGVQNTAIDFMYALPGLICFIIFASVVVLIIVIFVRTFRKRRARRIADNALRQKQQEQALDELRRSEK